MKVKPETTQQNFFTCRQKVVETAPGFTVQNLVRDSEGKSQDSQKKVIVMSITRNNFYLFRQQRWIPDLQMPMVCQGIESKLISPKINTVQNLKRRYVRPATSEQLKTPKRMVIKETPKISSEQKLHTMMRRVRDQVPLPQISAETWCVLDTDSGGQLVQGRLVNFRREVASLTKMMTFLVSYNLCQQFYPDEHFTIKIKDYCAKTIGTSAFLQTGDSFGLE